jgi:hypothetical protein
MARLKHRVMKFRHSVLSGWSRVLCHAASVARPAKACEDSKRDQPAVSEHLVQVRSSLAPATAAGDADVHGQPVFAICAGARGSSREGITLLSSPTSLSRHVSRRPRSRELTMSPSRRRRSSIPSGALVTSTWRRLVGPTSLPTDGLRRCGSSDTPMMECRQ